MALALIAFAGSPWGSATAKAAVLDDEEAVKTADYVVDADSRDSGVVQASYSTGASGAKLTWRPYRPSLNRITSPMQDEPDAQKASFDEPVEGDAVWNLEDPMSDPFGDRIQGAQLVPPANLQDDLLEKPVARPMPSVQVPRFVSQDETPKAESSQQSQQIQGGELEEALAAGPQAGGFKCPSPKELKPISRISYNITPQKGELPQECELGGEQFRARAWEPITFAWKASGLCHKPLYFEEVALERYGHTTGILTQPFVSAAHFFLTVPILPYKMGLYPPNECIYTLGYYRPGSCAPHILDPLPISVRAALFEAGAIVAGVAIIP